MRDTSFEISLFDADGKQLAVGGVVVDALFYCQGIKRYRFGFGLTDDSGKCRTTLENLDQYRREQGQLFIADYNTLLSDCDPIIGFQVPMAEELDARASAVRKWFPHRGDSVLRNAASARVHRVASQEQRFPIEFGKNNLCELICFRSS